MRTCQTTTWVPAVPATICSISARLPTAARLPGRLDEPGSGVDLRAHRAGSELLIAQLRRRHPFQLALVGGAPAGVHPVDVGGQHQELCVDLAGQQLAGEVLVDHGLDPDETAPRVGAEHRGHPTAAGADHDHALVEQPADGPDLEDALRLRRRDDAPPGVAVLLEVPRLGGRQRVRLVLRVDRPDELGRVVERGISRVDLDHRQERGERGVLRHHVAQLLLEHVADHSLRLGSEHVERVRPPPRCRPPPAVPAARPADRCRARGRARAARRRQPEPARRASRSAAAGQPSSAPRASAGHCRPAPRPRARRVSSGSEGGDHDGLDRVQAVLGLVEHDRGRRTRTRRR